MTKQELKKLIQELVNENNDEKFLMRIYISLLISNAKEKESD